MACRANRHPNRDPIVSLHGGLSHNGKPAELVHTTPEGKLISLASGEAISDEDLESAAMKRPALDVHEDDATRSMARRKKNAKPEIHTCELCTKQFKRPCDLTKHVKTHERPWKCSEVDCKYHEFGWPTEKERERHMNDKHSSAPSLYHCMFKPCPYTSKRESNCKQHMEKAHGWDYVRSKSNGKGKVQNVVRLPHGSVPPSPSSTMLTPLTPIAPSPSTLSYGESSRRSSMAPPPLAGPSTSNTISYGNTPAADFLGHFNMDHTGNFDFNDMTNFPTSAFPITPALSDDLGTSASVSTHSGAHYPNSIFGDLSPNQFMFDNNDFAFPANWHPVQTPDSSIAGPGSSATHISPAAHMEQSFNEDAVMEDTYGDFSNGPARDFTLFGSNVPAETSGDMFPSVSSWGNVDHMGMNFATPPSLPNGNTNAALAELFPELSEGSSKTSFEAVEL